MTQLIRKPPDLFSTEREKIELITVSTKFSPLLVKRSSSLRFLPLSSSSNSPTSVPTDFPIVGSEIGHGHFKNIEISVQKGFVCAKSLPVSPAKFRRDNDDSAGTMSAFIPAFVSCSKGSENNKWTVVSFELVEEVDRLKEKNRKSSKTTGTGSDVLSLTLNNNGDSSSGLSDIGNPNRELSCTDDQRHVYKARKRLKLSTTQSVCYICPLSSNPFRSGAECFAALLTNDSTPSQLTVQILNTRSLDTQATCALIIKSSKLLEVKEWKLTYLQSQHPEGGSFLAVWSSVGTGASQDIGFLSLSQDLKRLQFLGWRKFVCPETTKNADNTTSVKLLALKGVPLPVARASCPFVMRWNMLLFWSTATYQLVAIGTRLKDAAHNVLSSKKKHELVVVPMREYSAWDPSASYTTGTAVTLTPTVALELAWDNKQEILISSLRQLTDGSSFALASSSSEPQFSSKLGMDLPAPPISITATSLGKDVIVLMAVGKQIYRMIYRGLKDISSAFLLNSLKTKNTALALSTMNATSGYSGVTPASSLPSSHILQVLGLNNCQSNMIPETYQVLRCIFDNVNRSQAFYDQVLKLDTDNLRKLEHTVCQLISLNLTPISPESIQQLLEFGFYNAVVQAIMSPTTSEEIVSYLLQNAPERFLHIIIGNLSASRDILVTMLRRGLTVKQFEIILKILDDWFEILCVLPPAITQHVASSLPELHRTAEFLSVLLDAKFTELADKQNAKVLELLHSIAKNVAACLMVKRNLQKMSGQIFSILNLQSETLNFGKTKSLIEDGIFYL